MSLEVLPPALEALRERLRAFIHDELLPRERQAQLEEEAGATHELRQWVRSRSNELGFFRLFQPPELGGEGLGPLGQAVVREEIAASGSLLGRHLIGGNGGMLRGGTAEQREKYLQPALRGELSVSFAFTDARQGPRTTAERRDGLYVLNGVKSFVSGGPHADLLLTVATVTEKQGTPAGLGVFIVQRHAPGLTLRRELRTLDGGVHGEFELRDVQVSADDVLGEIGKGMPRVMENINGLRMSVAASACGSARWALQYTLSQVDQPHRTGTPLAEREQVQAMLADSATDLLAARSVLYETAGAAERGEAVDVETAVAKSLATEAATRIIDRAIQLTGGAAVVEGHPLARMYRQIRGTRIAEGTTEILRLTIARGLLARHRAASPAEPAEPEAVKADH